MDRITRHSLFLFLFFISTINAQIIPNGTIDNIDELSKKETIYIPMTDGTLLATDVSVPMFRDSVVTELEIAGEVFHIQVIPKDCQFIIYDTTNITPESYRLPIIFTRTPYDKEGEDFGSTIFPFLGYAYVLQDMRGRYESEGVYFPMYSDSWPKEVYHPEISISADVTEPSDLSHALKHRDGSESVLYLANTATRVGDFNLDGIQDTIPLSNGMIGMFGASALGNTQYQAISDIPFTEDNPLKCLVPIVATNEHYNTTLFNNGVFRNSIVKGWITGQIVDLEEELNEIDDDIHNNIHTPADYGYTDNIELSEDLIDWFVSEKFTTSSSGAHPNSLLRSDLDASMAPINQVGEPDANGTISRYRNVNAPAYHLTGWWDIFVNGQIETFNNIRKEHPQLRQKLVIGPWAHQTVGTNKTGDVTYPDDVFNILNFDMDFDMSEILEDSTIVDNIYNSELLSWYRMHLGGEPYFIIPESNLLQDVGEGNKIRIPSKNYVVPYYQFLNYIGKQSQLSGVPVEYISENGSTNFTISLPEIDDPLINLSAPLTEPNIMQIDQSKDVRLFITGPIEDMNNTDVGNYWFYTDSIPFKKGITETYFYLHQDNVTNHTPIDQHEGSLSYVANPHNPVVTIGGNNMIPNLPDEDRKSQGSINLANPDYAPLTMNREDVLSFVSPPFTDTMSVIGFPKAKIYAKGNTSNFDTDKIDFDVMIRILDVYPDGREMFITEGVVNAKSREYAKSISQADTNNAIVLSNINNDEFYYFEFDLLPLGHTFGKGHQIKFLLSSSNYPKYQSNPHIPNEDGEFFRWNPGESKTYSYQGQTLTPQNAEITYGFNPEFPNYIVLPQLVEAMDLGLETNQIAPQMNIYPNPTKGILNVKWDTSVEGELLLYDLTGNLILRNPISHSQYSTQLNIENLTKGIYLIQFPQLNQVKKLILE